jgi:hypothetical protein
MMPFKPHPTDPDKVILVSNRYDSQNYANEYERGFIDGMQKQMQSSVDKAVNSMGKREWVGLTVDEIAELVCNLEDPENRIELGQKIEAKLKERNT